MKNLPSVYKIARTRFNAANELADGAYLDNFGGAPGAQASATYHAHFYAPIQPGMMLETMQTAQYTATGSQQVATGTKYATANAGRVFAGG